MPGHEKEPGSAIGTSPRLRAASHSPSPPTTRSPSGAGHDPSGRSRTRSTQRANDLARSGGDSTAAGAVPVAGVVILRYLPERVVAAYRLARSSLR